MNKVEKRINSFASFDGTRIYYESRGVGEPIIYVYGLACLINHWHHQVSHFSTKYQTICFDLRGHHKSERPSLDENLTMTAMVKDIFCLMDHLQIKRAHFAGHSFGVPLLTYAFHFDPSRFMSLVLVNGFASNPIKNMFGIPAFEKIYDFLNEKYQRDPDLWKSLWKLGVENPFLVPLSSLAGGFNLKLTSLKDIQVYYRGVANMDLGVFLKLFGEMMSFDGEPYLSKITVPTLIIGGENDKVTPAKFQKDLADKIPKSELMLVHYGSHCTQLDFPEFTNLRIEKFYSDHGF